ncbi:MAG: hypothetical protein KF897_11995 [Opitutaceae bacterium]|nr:hypothetical protein [Opitutaceae bacterium]
MAPQRQDYLLRLIEELGRFVREALRSGEPQRAEAALPALVQAQERLFARPAAQFVGLTPEAQVDLLAFAESPATAQEKCATYAAILDYAAELYEPAGRPALALASREWANTVRAIAATRWPVSA